MHKTLTPSGTKSLPLTFQNIFERCTQYMKYFSLSSVYLYPRDMHLEEMGRLLEYHCNHSVCLREWISISHIEFIFSKDLLKQLAVALCNQQNFLLCGFHCCWYGELRREGSLFFLWQLMFSKKSLTTMNDTWMITALWNISLQYDWCHLCM